MGGVHQGGGAHAVAEVVAEVGEALGVGGELFCGFDEGGGGGGGEVLEAEVREVGVGGAGEGVGEGIGEGGGEGDDGDAHEEGVESDMVGVVGEGVEGDVDGVEELEVGQAGLGQGEEDACGGDVVVGEEFLGAVAV